MNNFSENLKKIRKDNNLSQEQLAEDLGVSRQAISKWESGQAYPEMDKIISICNKFNINIDDLLNNDIREIQGEEVTKNNINKHIDSFLSFITDTVNMFSNMKFKSKIKCIIEELIICFILSLISLLLGSLLENIFYNLFSFLPVQSYIVIKDILASIYTLFMVLLSTCVVVHIFKTRYLDYYLKEKENIEKKQTDYKEKNNNIVIESKKKDRIIIRDPKDSKYPFVNGLAKSVIFGIKIFMMIILIAFCLLLITDFAFLVTSLLIIKSGLFFTGVFLSLLSFSILTIIIILFLFNFIFNRKNEKKKMIWSFIISLIVFGCGIGITTIGSLDFNVQINNEYNTKSDIYKIKMNNDFFLAYDNVEYIEKDIENIEISYTINKNFNVVFEENSKYGSHFYIDVYNPIKIIKDILKDINNKQISIFNDEIRNIKIYASKENIEVMKNNYNSYIKNENIIQNNFNEYERIITNQENKIMEYEEKIEEYKNIIDSLK